MTFVEMFLFALLQHSDLPGYLRTTDITTTLQRTLMNFPDHGWRPSSYAWLAQKILGLRYLKLSVAQ
jgi:hypothetical protein